MSIEIRNVTKRFGTFIALDDVSLEIPEGSLTAVLGPSGGDPLGPPVPRLCHVPPPRSLTRRPLRDRPGPARERAAG